jgi:hypothetical protein
MYSLMSMVIMFWAFSKAFLIIGLGLMPLLKIAFWIAYAIEFKSVGLPFLFRSLLVLSYFRMTLIGIFLAPGLRPCCMYLL